jgi:hypothetical protein
LSSTREGRISAVTKLILRCMIRNIEDETMDEECGFRLTEFGLVLDD